MFVADHRWRAFACPVYSFDLDVMDADEVIPPLRDDKLDHYVAGWLLDSHLFVLHLTIAALDLLWLSNQLKSVSIGRRAPFNLYFLHISRQEGYIVHHAGLLKHNCNLLWEQSSCHPELRWLSKVQRHSISASKFLRSKSTYFVRTFDGSNLSSNEVAQAISICISITIF